MEDADVAALPSPHPFHRKKGPPTPMSREFPKNNSPKKVAPATIGRIVHVFSQESFGPMAAIVTDASEDDGLTISVCAFSGNGVPQPMVALKHASLPRHKDDLFWDWMPFQKGQAAKTEQLEQELKQAFGGPKGPGGY